MLDDLKIIRGAGGSKGGSGGQIATDTLASRQFAKIVIAVSEGEVEGLVGAMQGVYFDGVPLENPDGTYNFSGVSFYFQPGTQSQPYVPGFSDVENEVAVNLEIYNSSPLVRTITDPNANAVRVTVNLPAIYYTNTKNGDVTGSSVVVAVDIQTNGGGFVQTIYDTISGKSSAAYDRSYLINLDGVGPWDIRVRRVTADGTTGNPVNVINWASYTEIINAKLSYPNTATAYVTVDSGQFQSVPAVAFNLKGLLIQVPSNYDPVARTYTGAWDGTFKIAWSNNPAWCFYDLLTATRYGLGNFVAASQVDKWALYTIAQYCDGLVPDGFGGTEPRFTLNAYIQNYADAFKVLQDLASAFRGMPFWSTGSVTATQDAPSNAAAIFSPANVIDGTFTYTGASLKARHTVALVTWYNMADQAQPYVEYVTISDADVAKYGEIITQVTAFGCTSRGQANRLGKWILYSEKYEGETVAFKTGLDGSPVRPGDIVKIADPVRGGFRLGGKVNAASQYSLTVDSPLIDQNGNPVNAVGAALSAIGTDGSVQESAVAQIADNLVIQSFSRASVGTYIDSGGAMQTAAVNVPRIDYTTGSPLLLIEGAATNYNPYGSATGAAVGVLGSGGVLPTGWNLAGASGLAVDVVGVPVINGIPCVEVRIYGTPTSNLTEINTGNAFPIPIQSGNIPPFADSYYIGLTAGSVSNLNVVLWGYESIAGVDVNDIQPSITSLLTLGSFGRYTNKFPGLSGQSGAPSKPQGVLLYTTPGAPIDITLTLGAFQSEAGTVATSYISTSGAPVTRAADVAAYTTPPGAQTLILSSPLAVVPQPQAMWILELPTIQAQTFRLLQATRNERNEYTLTALTSNQSKYGYIDYGTNLVVQQITDLTQPPSAPAGVVCVESLYSYQSTVFSMAALSWSQVAGAMAYYVGWQKDSGNWQFATTPNNAFDINKTDPGSYDFRVWTIGPNGKKSTAYGELVQTLYGKTLPPSNVAGLSYGFDQSNGLILNWAPAPDIDVASYEVRRGPSWSAGVVVGQSKTTSMVVGVNFIAGSTYWVAVLDTQGVYSVAPQSVAPVVPAIAAPIVSATFAGVNAVVSWSAPVSAMTIDHYIISLDGGVTTLATVKGTSFSFKANFSGIETYSVAAVDISGTVGVFGDASLTMVLPSAPSISYQVIDNNVLLRWSASASTLPVDHYIVAVGATWAAAVPVGNIKGTFDTVFETQSGSYTYWVCGVDAAGNQGTPSAATVYVNAPPDYVLHYNFDSVFAGTKTNIATDTDGVTQLAPIDTATTYQAHFTNKSWTSPNDQVVAGYPLFIEPALLTASYVETIDYGSILPSSNIIVSLTSAVVSGAPGVSTTIAVSPDNVTWTTYPNTNNVFVSNFRYAQVTINVTGTAGLDVLKLTALNIKYQVKQKLDSGSAACVSTDSGGTVVNFNIPFISVGSITVTASGTVPLTAIYSFAGGADPTSFQILLFNAAGARVSGTASWTARGV